MTVLMKQGCHSFFRKVKPYVAMSMLQVGFAGMYVTSQAILKNGMNQLVLVVYCNVVAFIVIVPFAVWFERAKRPKMTRVIFFKIFILVVIDVLEQNLYYMGAKLTSASFVSAMENIIPAITYIMALLLRVETLDIRRRGGQLKITGTLLTVSGAVLLILYKGPMLDFLWFSKGVKQQAGSLGQSSNGGDPTSLMWIRGMIMLIGSTTCWSGFLILQSNTLESYPAELTITSLVCLMGAAASGAVAFLVERGNTEIWVIGWDMRLFTVVYSGIICTGVSYYVLGMVMKEKGPVFASAFSPLCTIITSLMSSIFLSETISLGMTIGAFIMIGGLYFLLWGKTKEELKFSQEAAVEASVITCDQVPNAEFEQENNYKSGSLPMESSYV